MNIGESGAVELCGDEQLVGDGAESLGLGLDQCEELLVLIRGQRRSPHGAYGTVDRCEWRPELVCGGGDELGAHPLQLAVVGDVANDDDGAVRERRLCNCKPLSLAAQDHLCCALAACSEAAHLGELGRNGRGRTPETRVRGQVEELLRGGIHSE